MQLEEREVISLWDSIRALSLRERVIAFYRAITHVETITPIDVLDLPTPTYRLLMRAGIQSVEQLQELTWGQLMSLRGVGVGKATAVRQALEEYNG